MKKRLELYIHIPFCVKKCNYCDFLSFASDEQTQAEYTKSLVKEIEFYGERLGNYSVSTIFIGGGTPSWLSEQLLSDIMLTVYDCFDVEENAQLKEQLKKGLVTCIQGEKNLNDLLSNQKEVVAKEGVGLPPSPRTRRRMTRPNDLLSIKHL